MDETCLGPRMVSWEKGRKKWTKLFGEGRRERAPDRDDEGAELYFGK